MVTSGYINIISGDCVYHMEIEIVNTHDIEDF